MEVTVVQETPWSRALDAARRTIGKEPLPSKYYLVPYAKALYQ